MFKKLLIIAVSALFMTQAALANEMMMKGPHHEKSKQCQMIAQACRHAGYRGKAFWFSCMKPVLYNESVRGVKVDSKVVQACRAHKIKKGEKKLNELKKIQEQEKQ